MNENNETTITQPIPFTKEDSVFMHACSKPKDGKYYMTESIHLDPVENKLVATDGRLMLIKDCNQNLKDFVAGPINVKIPTIKAKEERTLSSLTSPEYGFESVWGKYPNYKQVETKATEYNRGVTLSVEILEKLIKVAKGNNRDNLRLSFKDDSWSGDTEMKRTEQLQPVRIDMGDNISGVLMPLLPSSYYNQTR